MARSGRASRIRILSENPGKRAAERWYLLYTPIWGAIAGLVMTTGMGVQVPMEVLAQIAGSAYALVALVIGVRLVVLWMRSRELPELLIGSSMLLLAGLGYPLSAVAREATDLAAPTREILGAAAGLLALTGLTANTAFTWVLFRRDAVWATTLVASIAVVALGLFAAQSAVGGWTRGELFWGWLPALITISYGWASFECGRYHLLLRRRLEIGLADPVVTDRFGVYAAATGMAVLINLVGWVFWWLRLEMLTHPIGGTVLFVCGTLSSGLMMLAFVPPRAYLARVRMRAAGSAWPWRTRASSPS